MTISVSGTSDGRGNDNFPSDTRIPYVSANQTILECSALCADCSEVEILLTEDMSAAGGYLLFDCLMMGSTLDMLHDELD